MFKKLISILWIFILCISVSAYSEGNGNRPELLIEKLQEATNEELIEALRMIESEQRSRLKARIVLDTTELSLAKAGKHTFAPEILDLPKDLTPGKYEWNTSDASVARVDSRGIVTAVGVGECKIVCSCWLSNGLDLRSECSIKVYIPVSRISFKQQNIKVARKTSIVLEPAVSPVDATDKDLLFESSDLGIASISAKGILTANEIGTCSITVTPHDGSGKSATIKVTVVQEVQGITLDSSEKTIEVGKTTSLKGIVTPETAANKQLDWSSSNESVATVGNNGNIVGKEPGKTVITAKSTDGTALEAYAELTVIQPMKKIAVQDTVIVLAENVTWKQHYNIEPKNTTEKGVHWVSSNDKIASVNEEGTVTGISDGKCVITGTAADGMGASVKINVEVKKFDYVLTKPEELVVEFPTEYDSSVSIGITNRGMFQKKEERITDFGKKECVTSTHPGTITPLKAGSDVITVTWKVNNKVVDKKTYTVFVAQSAVE